MYHPIFEPGKLPFSSEYETCILIYVSLQPQDNAETKNETSTSATTRLYNMYAA